MYFASIATKVTSLLEIYFPSIATKVTSLLEIYFASIAIKVTSLLERFIHLFFIFINNMRTPIENLALPLIFL